MRFTLARVGRLLVPWLLALGLACQGTSPPATSMDPATARPSPVPLATAGLTPAAPTGLAGQVLAASDVAGQPDEPLPDQLVLAVAVERAGEVLGPGTADLAEPELRFLKASLPAPHPAVVTALTGAAGRFALALPAGAYLLCLADSDVTPPGFPARTRGCGRVEVPAGSVRQVDISSGFGEILLISP